MKGRPIDWQPEELAWIEARKEWPRAEAHAMFCARFMRSDVSIRAYNSLCKRKGWLTGRTGCFEKGHATHNKGQPMPEHVKSKVKATMFKPGRRPHTWRGAGHERIDSKDGYVYMIVAETNPWTGAATRPVQKHRYLWEQANGPVPPGHALKCLDGDRTNTNPSNWTPVPKAMLPRLAAAKRGIAYDSAPDELKPVIMTTARLEHAAREARKANRRDE